MSDPIRMPPRTVDTGVRTEGPVRTGWTVTSAPIGSGSDVDDLADVDAPPTSPGVLERQADQIVRPVTRTALIADHVNSPTPHPAYDDLPSLTLLFRNGLI